MNEDVWQRNLREKFGGLVRFHEPMSARTSLRVGGPADAIVSPASGEEMADAVRFCEEEGIPWVVLGQGSNAIVRDGGIRGLVFSTREKMNCFWIDGCRVRAQAGVGLPVLARETASRGLRGLEFGAGIPGTVGGAAWINAGTKQGEIGDVIENVSVLGTNGEVLQYRRGNLSLGYRSSRFVATKEVLIEAEILLEEDFPKRTLARIREEMEHRKKTQPLQNRSVGCIFKNPLEAAAGRLIDLAGCKGWQEGGARVSKKHGNFLVTRKGTTCSEVLRLIDRVRGKVLRDFGVELEREAVVIGVNGNAEEF